MACNDLLCMPEELIMKMLQYLNFEDLIHFGFSSKYCQSLAKERLRY